VCERTALHASHAPIAISKNALIVRMTGARGDSARMISLPTEKASNAYVQSALAAPRALRTATCNPWFIPFCTISNAMGPIASASEKPNAKACSAFMK
jgi:hypothetical protein